MMKRPTLWTAAAIAAIAAASSTREQREEARRRLARWNPLFIAMILGGLAFIFWPWSPPAS